MSETTEPDELTETGETKIANNAVFATAILVGVFVTFYVVATVYSIFNLPAQASIPDQAGRTVGGLWATALIAAIG